MIYDLSSNGRESGQSKESQDGPDCSTNAPYESSNITITEWGGREVYSGTPLKLCSSTMSTAVFVRRVRDSGESLTFFDLQFWGESSAEPSCRLPHDRGAAVPLS